MMTLVTGATGFVGSHLVRQLLERGERVRVLVRPASSMRALEGLGVEVVRGDLRNASAVHAAMRGIRRVFHVGADYRLWASNPAEIYESNVLGTRNILSAVDAGVERVVYTSTVATIAVPRDRLPDETTDACIDEMVGHYKRSKFLAERVVLDAATRGMRVVIVNPTTPVGPGDWRPTPTGNVILDFLRRRLPAYVETGLNVVPVEDVARGHLLAAEHGRVGERYLLGGRNMTLKELLDAVARIAVSSDFTPDRWRPRCNVRLNGTGKTATSPAGGPASGRCGRGLNQRSARDRQLHSVRSLDIACGCCGNVRAP